MTIKELKEKITELNAELDKAGSLQGLENARHGRHPSHIAVELMGAQSELVEALERELRDFFTVEQFEEIEAKQIGAALPWCVDIF